MRYAQVVELVDTLSWGGSGESRAGSSPALGTISKSSSNYWRPNSPLYRGFFVSYKKLLSINVHWHAVIDGNGRADALTDGLIILRYLFGLRGDVLINGVVAPDASITSADGVGAKVESLMPAL